MASRTVKKKKPGCKCEINMQLVLADLDEIKRRQDILMDGHTHLSDKVKALSLWQLIKNCFRRK